MTVLKIRFLNCALICLLISLCHLMSHAQVSNCNLLCNIDFEDAIVVNLGTWTLVNQNAVPCWNTTATDGMIEVWGSGFNGVPAYSGSQFIELNANMVSTIYQNFNAVAGFTAFVSFAHRGRQGTDVMSVEIGPVGGPYVNLGTFSAGNTAWIYNTVSYTFPAVITGLYTLRFNSISAAGGNIAVGNFLDDINIAFPTPDLTYTSNGPSCPGVSDGSIQLTITGGTPPYQVQWSNGATGIVSQNNLPAGSYSVTITDAYGCSLNNTIVLSTQFALTAGVQSSMPACYGLSDGSIQLNVSGGTPPYTVAWAGLAQTGLQATGLASGSYTFVVTDLNGCTATGTETLLDPPPLIVNATANPDSICAGASTTLSASGGIQYQWSYGASGGSVNVMPAMSGYYSVLVTDLTSCTALDSVFVAVMDNPVMTLTNDTLCFGEPYQPAYTLSGGPASGIAWDMGDGNLGTGTSLIHTYDQSGVYSVQTLVTNVMGCTAFANANVIVWPLPQASLELDPTTGCEPLTVTLTDKSVAHGDPIVQVRWLPWGILGSSSYTHIFQQAGTFDVGIEVRTQSGCQDDTLLIDAITVYPQAIAGFTVLNQSISEILPRIEIRDLSTNAAAWEWNFSDGFSSTLTEPVHTFGDTGTYYIQQIVITPEGCNDTLWKEITVFPDQMIWAPNAFSPNGDNQNERFTAIGWNIIEFRLEIINRWGQKIYVTTDMTTGWDGRYQDIDSPEDVYSYIITYKDIAGRERILTGRVTLVR